MANSRRKSFVATLVGGGANTALSSLFALILTPLVLRHVDAAVFGAWLASGDLLVWLQCSDLGLSTLIIQRVGAAHGKGDLDQVARYFGTGFVFIVVGALLAGIVGWCLSLALPYLLRLQGPTAHLIQSCFQWGIVATFCNLLQFAFVGYFRAIQRTVAVNVFALIGTVLNFFLVVLLLWMGWGLKAVVAGALFRAVFTLVGVASWFGMREWSKLRGRPLYDGYSGREMLRAAPATALGMLGFAVMNSSDSFIIGVTMGSSLVPAYSFTKKAADVIRSLLDITAFAAYPSFAHLVGSEQRHRAHAIYRDVCAAFMFLAVCGTVGYMTMNRAFVTAWVGSAYFAGTACTILFGFQMATASGSLLTNYLYRSSGPVVRGSLIFSLEALFKLPLMFFAAAWLGYVGIPLASIVLSGCFVVINFRLTRELLSKIIKPVLTFSKATWLVPGACLGLGILSAILSRGISSSWSVALGILSVVACAALMWLRMPGVRSVVRRQTHLEPAAETLSG